MLLLEPKNKSFCLEQVCQANYEKIFRLIPNLCDFKDKAIGVSPDHMALTLTLIEQAPYTMTIELSHSFDYHARQKHLPAVRIRVYLDAGLAEVLNDHARPEVTSVFQDFSFGRDIMNYKWRLNYFLQKWLDHCLTKNYRFSEPSFA